MRIDAHQHFWIPARNDYGWLPALRGEAAVRLNRPILPAELAPILEQHGVQKSVLVQAAPSEAEGEFLLDLAEQHAFVAAVVVWLDMESADFERRLDAMAARDKFRGVRPMLQDIADPAWMLRSSVQGAFAAIEERGICFDFLIRPHQLSATLALLERFPQLHAVVDHIAKPNIRARELAPWDALIERVAEHDNVYCKLSGMITEADPDAWVPSDLAPYIQHIVRCFGTKRLMFGSDWPVCTLAGSYDRVVQALEQNLAPLSLGDAALQQIFGGTAQTFYGLPDPDLKPAGAAGAGA